MNLGNETTLRGNRVDIGRNTFLRRSFCIYFYQNRFMRSIRKSILKKSSFIFEKFQNISKKPLEIINILKFSIPRFSIFPIFPKIFIISDIFQRSENFQNWFSYRPHKPFLIKIDGKWPQEAGESSYVYFVLPALRLVH